MKTAADRILQGKRGRPKIYNFDENDVKKIKQMAVVGLSNEAIAIVMGCNPATFDRILSEHKKIFEAGEADNTNVYEAVELGKASAGYEICKTAFDVATKDRNIPMLIWLTKTRLKWTDSINVNQNINHVVVYETQLAEGVIRQTQKSIEENNSYDALIEQVTEDSCQKQELE